MINMGECNNANDAAFCGRGAEESNPSVNQGDAIRRGCDCGVGASDISYAVELHWTLPASSGTHTTSNRRSKTDVTRIYRGDREY